MKITRNSSFRFLTFALLFIALGLAFTAIFTVHWFEQGSRRLTVIYSKGLWKECGIAPFVYNNNTRMRILIAQSVGLLDQTPFGVIVVTDETNICRPIEENNITSDLLVARVLQSITIGLISLAIVVAVIMKVAKRSLNMDIISIIIFIAISVEVGCLAQYYECNRSRTNFNFRYAMGYSYMIGWLTFIALVFANLFSIVSRIEEH